MNYRQEQAKLNRIKKAMLKELQASNKRKLQVPYIQAKGNVKLDKKDIESLEMLYVPKAQATAKGQEIRAELSPLHIADQQGRLYKIDKDTLTARSYSVDGNGYLMYKVNLFKPNSKYRTTTMRLHQVAQLLNPNNANNTLTDILGLSRKYDIHHKYGKKHNNYADTQVLDKDKHNAIHSTDKELMKDNGYKLRKALADVEQPTALITQEQAKLMDQHYLGSIEGLTDKQIQQIQGLLYDFLSQDLEVKILKEQ